LDVIVGESAAIFELFSGKNETLLIWRNSFLVLNFLFDIFDGVGRFYCQCDCLSCQSFNKYLHFKGGGVRVLELFGGVRMIKGEKGNKNG